MKFITAILLINCACINLLVGQVGPTQEELNQAHNNFSDWLLPNHDYGGQRYVELEQITKEDIKDLRVASIYQVADLGVFETNPIVYQGIMYITTTLSTIALDAVTSKPIWRHEWEPKAKEMWPMHRGAALKDGILVRGTSDGYLFALDAKTGETLWEHPAANPEIGEMFTMSPLIFDEMILIGPAGSEEGVRGWVGAFNLKTGEPIWKFYTIPGEGEAGSETWGNPESRLHGGGAIWTQLSIDQEAGILYVPVGNPAPDWFDEDRPGDNLYTCSMLALDVRTGEYKWHYQVTPHDVHDYDLTQVSPLFSTTIQGKKRNLITVVGKEGLLNVLDRETKEHLYQVPVTTQKNVTAPITVEGTYACPGVHGGVEWNGPAYNPITNMLYVNAVEWCATLKKAKTDPTKEGNYWGGTFEADPFEESKGWLSAIDASTGNIKWQYEADKPLLAAITTTSTGLLFTGEMTGDFIALDATNGEVLYRFNTGGPVIGGIVAYSVNSKEYIAVMSGATSGYFAGLPGSATVIVFEMPNK